MRQRTAVIGDLTTCETWPVLVELAVDQECPVGSEQRRHRSDREFAGLDARDVLLERSHRK